MKDIFCVLKIFDFHDIIDLLIKLVKKELK